jgi:subtilisin family serine protease
VAYIGADAAIPAPAPVEVLPTVDAPEAIEWNISLIGADQVWITHSVTGTGIVVSNIDTGVQWDHPALINQYRGWDGSTVDHNFNWWDPYGQSPLVPNDADQHGTHTMGTMVGSDNPADPVNATNAIGVAPGAQWFACDGFDDNTGFGYNVELLECAEFILAPWDLTGANPNPDLRADVVNNSWGGGQAQWWYNQAVYAWRAAGILPIFSAGNAGPSCETAGDPGDMANIMAVGATTNTDAIASFSSRGPALITGLTKPDVSAPGVNIRSSVPGNAYQGGWSGTSMAAPHVAGTAALIWAAVPELRGDVQLTYWILEQSALGLTTDQGCGGDLPDEIPNNVFGWGRINALDAVELAMTQWEVPWLAVDPLNGTVAPDGTQDVTLTLDSTGMAMDTCANAWLKVEYNDPYTVEQFVPVELCVVERPVVIYYTMLPILFK